MSDKSIIFSIGSLDIRWYGILLVLAIIVGIVIVYRESVRQKLDPDFAVNLILFNVVFGFIAARFYYVIFNWGYYSKHLVEIFTIWKDSGMSIYGAILAGIVITWLYTRRKKQSFFRWADIFVLALVLGQAIGCWGNYFNGDILGTATSLPWAFVADGVSYHPVFLYESIWCILVFVFLVWLIRRRHRVGSVFLSYLILYSFGRFFIELVSEGGLKIGSVSQALVASVVGVIVGGFLLLSLLKRHKVDVKKPEAAVVRKGANRQQMRAHQREQEKEQLRRQKTDAGKYRLELRDKIKALKPGKEKAEKAENIDADSAEAKQAKFSFKAFNKDKAEQLALLDEEINGETAATADFDTQLSLDDEIIEPALPEAAESEEPETEEIDINE